MKLRNKKTGEIVDFGYLQSDHIAPLVLTAYENNKPEMFSYNSLAELNEEWEDYEEPKEYWFIDEFGLVQEEVEYYYEDNKEAIHDKRISVGNFFETKEEAEKAVEKLKAWKRLKDKGFKFTGFNRASVDYDVNSHYGISDDLDLLFGDEQ